MASVQDKVRTQVEFYFSDSNLPQDKFLRSQCASNPQGFVSVALIASFKKMREITEDLEAVVAALRTSDKLEVSEDGTMVRRKDPLPEEDVTLPRSIHAKEFPEDVQIEQLQEFFSKYGNVISVRIRKHPKTKAPKGSAFIEFANEEEANKVLEQTIEFNGKALTMTRKDKWVENKKTKLKPAAAEKSEEGEKKKPSKEEIITQYRESNLSRFTGCIAKITGFPAETTYNQIKELFASANISGFVEKEEDSAMARFDSAEDCQKVIAEFNGKELNGQTITVVAASTEDELKYCQDKAEKDYERGWAKGGKGGRGRGRGRGGRGGRGGKRGREGDFDRPAKKQRTE